MSPPCILTGCHFYSVPQYRPRLPTASKMALAYWPASEHAWNSFCTLRIGKTVWGTAFRYRLADDKLHLQQTVWAVDTAAAVCTCHSVNQSPVHVYTYLSVCLLTCVLAHLLCPPAASVLEIKKTARNARLYIVSSFSRERERERESEFVEPDTARTTRERLEGIRYFQNPLFPYWCMALQ